LRRDALAQRAFRQSDRSAGAEADLPHVAQRQRLTSNAARVRRILKPLGRDPIYFLGPAAAGIAASRSINKRRVS